LSSKPIILTRGLCKSYGEVDVLHDVSLNIEPGKLVGFLGPNGAGKSTTIRILLGLLNASAGNCELFGLPVATAGPIIRRRVGYLPGDVNLYSNLTGRKTLDFLARARRVNCSQQIDRLANVFELPLNRNVRSYSTGMKQKLGLIQAMMHRPDLLILDEPTSALDPLVRQAVFSELRNVIADGRSVLFSSHSLNEVEELCDEVIILRQGRVVEHQKIEVLQGRALRRIEITFVDAASIPESFPSALQVVKQNGRTINCTWSKSTDELLGWLVSHKLDDLIIERPDLNDLFITYYADEESYFLQEQSA
jgi:ABC-2 type transport system ATP-binding protein